MPFATFESAVVLFQEKRTCTFKAGTDGTQPASLPSALQAGRWVPGICCQKWKRRGGGAQCQALIRSHPRPGAVSLGSLDFISPGKGWPSPFYSRGGVSGRPPDSLPRSRSYLGREPRAEPRSV